MAWHCFVNFVFVSDKELSEEDFLGSIEKKTFDSSETEVVKNINCETLFDIILAKKSSELQTFTLLFQTKFFSKSIFESLYSEKVSTF